MNNKTLILEITEYIENNLESPLSLDIISRQFNYSKYHLHHLFSHIVGIPLYQYIQQRKLSNAAFQLVYSDKSLLDIALNHNYQTQQAFNYAFKKSFHHTPMHYRKRKHYRPLINKFSFNKITAPIYKFNISIEKKKQFLLLAYQSNTKKGFYVIGKMHRKLNKSKHLVNYRIDDNHSVSLNDYQLTSFENPKDFNIYVGVFVSSNQNYIKDMHYKQLPISNYLVFTFKDKNQNPMDKIANEIYQNHILNSTYQLNEQAPYDFIIYDDQLDENKLNTIRYYIPIK